MSQWMDPIDDEFLAAPGVNTEPAIDDLDVEGSEADWSADQGFPDPYGAIRVWADEAGDLAKVRVSLSWKDRVGVDGLATAFGVAFTMMNVYLHPDDNLAPMREAPRSSKKASWDDLGRLRQERRAINQQLEALGSGPESYWEGHEASASAFEDGVRVYLNIHRRPARVEFDREWLEESATASEIARGVQTAYRHAYQKWTPPTPVWTQRGELQQRSRQLIAEMDEIMRQPLSIM